MDMQNDVIDEYFEVDSKERVEIIIYVNEIAKKMPIWEEGGVKELKVDFNKIGRNEKCPCGSGLKLKKCCGKNI